MKPTTTLLSQLIQGKESALRVVYDQYADGIYQLAYHILKQEEHAEEIVQDTFIQLWDSRATLDVNGNLKAFLFVVARNKSFNRLKSLKRQQRLFEKLLTTEEYTHYTSPNPLAEKEVNELAEKIINKLPAQQQLVFRLSRIEGLSHKEIAQTLSISSHTVKNHLVAALKSLRTELQKANFSPLYSLVLLYPLV